MLGLGVRSKESQEPMQIHTDEKQRAAVKNRCADL